jgi:iron complex outermembrane receptor protein
VVRNIDATTWGGEAGVTYKLSDTWKADAALSYVRGDNDTDGTALAQLPPLEGRLGVNYDNKVWTVGALWRLVSSQDRVDANKGTIVGQDIGATSGFGIFSVNGGYRAKKGVLISGGIDSLLDRLRRAHQRAGAMVALRAHHTHQRTGAHRLAQLNVSLA